MARFTRVRRGVTVGFVAATAAATLGVTPAAFAQATAPAPASASASATAPERTDAVRQRCDDEIARRRAALEAASARVAIAAGLTEPHRSTLIGLLDATAAGLDRDRAAVDGATGATLLQACAASVT